jgi:ribonuclease HII
MRSPTFFTERDLEAQGYVRIAGIDEAGRGALAGPVVAAAVVLPGRLDARWLSAVRDSKQLSPSRRAALFEHIRESALAIGIGIVSSGEIDAWGILEATRGAMRSAVTQLPFPPDVLLIDAVELPDFPFPQKSLIRGDSLCVSIACASIVAKVTRDRIMEELDKLYPGYGLRQHKGYATPQHLKNLSRLGPSPVHRRSFAPVQELLP